MKKLLVLALVLSMATIANAGLKFQLSTGETTAEVAPSDTVIVQLVTDEGTSVTGWGFDALVGEGTASGAAISSVFESQTLGEMNPAEGLLSWYTYAGNSEIPLAYNSGVLYSFTLHIPDLPGSTIITITTMSDDIDYLPAYYQDTTGYIEENFGALTLHVVPEPITMALLGLGGLLLRRRK